MRRRRTMVGKISRAVVAALLASWVSGMGATSPAEGQEVEQVLAGAELHHSSVFDGAVQCPASAVRYSPADYWGALVGDGAQGGAFLLAQCGDRLGILRMGLEDTDPVAGRPPASIRVTITGFLFRSGLVSCATDSVVVDLPDARGIGIFERTMTLFGCNTWWRADMRVAYGHVLPSSFCPLPSIIWC